MNNFSSKFGYDERTSNEVIEDAPSWTRVSYITDILDDLLFVDNGEGFLDSNEGRPIGIKYVHKLFCKILRTEMSDEDWDDWHCKEYLLGNIKTVNWYFFYDFVQLIGKELKRMEGSNFLFSDEEVEKYKFKYYRAKVNKLFKNDNIVWRLNDEVEFTKKIPIVLDEYLNKVEGDLLDDLAIARTHYRKSKQYLYKFPTDIENSIKEIITSIETIGKMLYPNALTLGQVIKELRKNKDAPNDLINVIEKFYIFTNNAHGIRHGTNKQVDLGIQDAEFCFYLGVSLIRYLLSVKEKKDKVS